jgi:uncharacterized protein
LFTGFITLWMAVLSVVFLVCALRTNICFVIIFLSLIINFCLLTSAYWLLAADYAGNAAAANKMVVVSDPCKNSTAMDRD